MNKRIIIKKKIKDNKFYFQNKIYYFICDKILQKKWFYSTNHKDIGTLYIIFSIFAGLLGTYFSMIIRTELAYPGFQYFNGDLQYYNVVITGHAFIMIVRHCVFICEAFINSVYTHTMYILQQSYFKVKTKKKKEHGCKRMFNIYLKNVKNFEQSFIWLKLNYLNTITKISINEGNDKFSYGSLAILKWLKSCYFKVCIVSQIIKHDLTVRKVDLCKIKTSIKGTLGYPKGIKTYNVFYVSLHKRRYSKSNGYIFDFKGDGVLILDNMQIIEGKQQWKNSGCNKDGKECLLNKTIFTQLEQLSKISNNQKDKKINFKLYNLLLNEAIFELAYNNLKKKNKLYKLDVFSLDYVQVIINELKVESYKPQEVSAVKRANITGGYWNFSFISLKDKLVQESVRLILEIIYESRFSENSHGFRLGRSTQSAINLIKNNFININWVADVVVVKCFNNFTKEIIISIMNKHIADKRFLNLIKKFLNCSDVYFNESIFYDVIDISKVSIIGPILCNILLHEMDEYILNKKKVVEIKVSTLNATILKCLQYVRYANLFLIGCGFSRYSALFFMERLRFWLETNLGINIKYKLLNLSNETVKFLGFNLIWVKSSLVNSMWTDSKGKKYSIKRIFNKKLYVYAPIFYIMKCLRFVLKNLKKNKLANKIKWYHNNLEQIVSLFKCVVYNYINYYRFVNNYKKVVSIINYVCRYSMLKFLVIKYSAKTICQVIKKVPAIKYKLYSLSYN